MSTPWAGVASRLIRLIEERAPWIPPRDAHETGLLVLLCKQQPSARALALLTWDHVENVIAAEGLQHALPPPASSAALAAVTDTIERRYCTEPPELLMALLAEHDGLGEFKCSAFFSAERIVDHADAGSTIEPTVLRVSGSVTGNNAVLRVAPAARDDGAVFAFWHEDYAKRGLEPLAPSIVEYLAAIEESVIDTIRGQYGGPGDI